MANPRFGDRGRDGGDEPVESACEHVVGLRLKRGGMRWPEPGSQAVVSLRCARLNGDRKAMWERQPLLNQERPYEPRGRPEITEARADSQCPPRPGTLVAGRWHDGESPAGGRSPSDSTCLAPIPRRSDVPFFPAPPALSTRRPACPECSCRRLFAAAGRLRGEQS